MSLPCATYSKLRMLSISDIFWLAVPWKNGQDELDIVIREVCIKSIFAQINHWMTVWPSCRRAKPSPAIRESRVCQEQQHKSKYYPVSGHTFEGISGVSKFQCLINQRQGFEECEETSCIPMDTQTKLKKINET